MKITSVNNSLVKETAKLLQKKYRDETDLFLLEGEKCIEEALESGLEITNLFLEEGYQGFKTRESIETTQAVLSKMSSTATPPKCIAVAKQLKRKWSDDYKKVVLLENIRDAGNLGTILRASCAFGVDAIILYGDTVDLYNPKCVRASVGNLWKMPVFEMKNELEKRFAKYERIATLPKSDNTIGLKEYIPQDRVLIMFGSEATGLTPYLKKFATKNVTIEMSKNVESLNLSTSVGIFLYKIW